jgi:hypothetical protein
LSFLKKLRGFSVRKKAAPVVDFLLRKKPYEPTYEKIEYFNGPCPKCASHIGIDVFKAYSTVDSKGEKVSLCPVCGAEIKF